MRGDAGLAERVQWLSVNLRDAKVLKALPPDLIDKYLLRMGWEREVTELLAATFTGPRCIKVTLPLTQTFDDYAIRIGELLVAVGIAVDESPNVVYANIMTASKAPDTPDKRDRKPVRRRRPARAPEPDHLPVHTLQLLTPEAIEKYLLDNAWTQGKLHAFTAEFHGPRGVTVLLPLFPERNNYVQRVGELLEGVSSVTQRTPVAVYREIVKANTSRKNRSPDFPEQLDVRRLQSLVGSEERLKELSDRVARGVTLFNPDDCQERHEEVKKYRCSSNAQHADAA